MGKKAGGKGSCGEAKVRTVWLVAQSDCKYNKVLTMVGTRWGQFFLWRDKAHLGRDK